MYCASKHMHTRKQRLHAYGLQKAHYYIVAQHFDMYHCSYRGSILEYRSQCLKGSMHDQVRMFCSLLPPFSHQWQASFHNLISLRHPVLSTKSSLRARQYICPVQDPIIKELIYHVFLLSLLYFFFFWGLLVLIASTN